MRAEKTRQLNSKKMAWVINPDSSGAIIWQLITSCCMCFVAIVTPIQARFSLFLASKELRWASWNSDSTPCRSPAGVAWRLQPFSSLQALFYFYNSISLDNKSKTYPE